MRGAILMLAGLWCGGCDLGRGCNEVACGGGWPQIALVDDAGNPTPGVSGEYRCPTCNAFNAEPRAFDCAAEPEPYTEPTCEGGVLTARIWVSPDISLEVRFAVSDGSFTDWQPVKLHLTEHTDPDFNGPGCSCTYYRAAVEPAVVPAEALAPE